MAPRPGAYFEDLTPGDSWETAGHTFTEAAIIDFAFRFDPQPFHIDAEAAKSSMWGGIIASGFHTLAMSFRLVHQTGVLAANNVGGKGMDRLRWHRPVRPGDTLRVRVEVVSAERSRSNPDRGNVTLRYIAFNQRVEEVMSVEMLHLVACREQ